MNPLQTELNKIEQRAAAESALVIANAAKIDAIYALADLLQEYGAGVNAIVTLHLHSSEADTCICVYSRDETAVETILAAQGIDLDAPMPGWRDGMTLYTVSGTACALAFCDRPYVEAAA